MNYIFHTICVLPLPLQLVYFHTHNSNSQCKRYIYVKKLYMYTLEIPFRPSKTSKQRGKISIEIVQ